MRRSFTLALIFSAVILCDQGSKYWIQQHLLLGEERPVLPFLSLFYTYNEGLAFSFFSFFPVIFIILGTLSILLFLVYQWTRIAPSKKLTVLGYVFIISGALSNLIDRIFLHHVIDFIYFHIEHIFYFAIFNFADMSITLGAFLIILEEFLLWRRKRLHKRMTSMLK